MKPTFQQIKDAYLRKKYTFFNVSKAFNLNIWGIRKQTGKVNIFDDLLGVCYYDEHKQPIILYHKATVDPGKFYMVDKKATPKGTFVLAPGQYKGAWEKGKHKGKYIALRQIDGYTGFKGWRDNILNGQLDRRLQPNGKFFTDVIGLNMHRSSESFSEVIGKFSAGCQVRQINVEHKAMMQIIDKALKIFPNKFSYTLFDEEDVFTEIDFTMNGRNRGRSLAKKWPDDYINVEKNKG